MKKQVYKPLSILLSLLLLFSAVCGMGTIRAFAAADEPVAEIYLCFCGIHLPYFFGHTWLCIVNTGNAPITVGEETVEPGGMISVGLHADGGMTYNLEMTQFRGENVTAEKATLTAEALQRTESEILSSNWNYYNVLFHNCAHFSAAVWKAATGENYRPSIFPLLLRAQVPAEKRSRLYIA